MLYVRRQSLWHSALLYLGALSTLLFWERMSHNAQILIFLLPYSFDPNIHVLLMKDFAIVFLLVSTWIPLNKTGIKSYSTNQNQVIAHLLSSLSPSNSVFSMIDGLSPESHQGTFLDVAREIFADGHFNWGRVVMLFYFAYKMAKKVSRCLFIAYPLPLCR